MPSKFVQPYLFFGGRCDEAIEFYRTAIAAEVEMVMHFNESPDPVPPGMIPPGFESKVMHSSFKVGDSVIMASDGTSEGANFQGVSLSLSVKSPDEAKRAFEALAEGGQVTMPLNKTFWSPLFGMLTDKFGLGWMVNVADERGE